MVSRPAFFLLGIFVVSLEIFYCDLSCDYFKTNSTQLEADSSVTLRFTLNDDCCNKNNTVEIVTVLKWKDEPPHELICYVSYKTGCKIFHSNNCACDKQSKDFSVTWHMDGESQNETMLLSIRLQNGEERQQRIPVKLSSQQSQFTTVDPALSESETSTTQGDATVSKVSSQQSQFTTVDPALSESETSTTQGDATVSKVSSQQSQFTTVDPALSESETNTTQGDATVSKDTSTIQSEHVLIGMVVLSVAVVVVFVALTITCRLQLQSLKMLSRKRSVISGSRTGHYHNADGRRNLAVDPAALYRGQNVSVTITNELYEPSGGAVGREGAVWGDVPSAPRDRMQPPEDGGGVKTMVAGGASLHCGEGDYAEIGNPVQRDEQHCKQKKTVVDGNTSNGGACGGMDLYVDVEDIMRRKAEQRRQKEAAEGEGDYAEIGTPVQRDEQHGKQKKTVVNGNTSNGGACGGMDPYVDVEDIMRRKAEQRRQKEAAEGEGDYAEIGTPVQRDEQHGKQKKTVVNCNTSNGGACGGMDPYVDVEDIMRRKAEQRRQKEAAEGEGDYAEIGTPVQRDEQHGKHKKTVVDGNTSKVVALVKHKFMSHEFSRVYRKRFTSSERAGCGVADLYVDVEDIRRRKAEQRTKKEAAGGSCGEENLYVNVKPYIKVRKLKQRRRKAAAGVAAVIPGTTVNPLYESVEELEAERQRNKEKEKAEETETRK